MKLVLLGRNDHGIIAGLDNGLVLLDEPEFYHFKDMEWRWTEQGYLRHSRGMRMHRMVMALELNEALENHKGDRTEIVVDHINGERSDNRRCNLRVCTILENGQNKCLFKNNTVQVPGCCFDKRAGKYKVRIQVNGHRKNLGLFETKEEARIAYVEASKLYYKKFSRFAK